MSTSLISVTPEAERFVVWIARVSNPQSQGEEKNNEKLINYLINHKHWSPFEHGYMTVQIDCPKYVSCQILRHRSFTFQEYSMRYAKYHTISGLDFPIPELRKRGATNRQSSLQMISDDDIKQKQYYEARIGEIFSAIRILYNDMSHNEIANESLRNILPVCHMTRIIMTGSIRSYIHYIELRTQSDTQKEHREIAEDIKTIFCQQFPLISKALKWLE